MRHRVSMTAFPSSPGVYVVYENKGDRRPLYAGVAERQTLLQRWQKNHLRPRTGGSALRRTLGVHLGLVKQKLRQPKRCYPAEVEAEITRFLKGCWVELHQTKTGGEAVELERQLIRRLRPRLNVVRPR